MDATAIPLPPPPMPNVPMGFLVKDEHLVEVPPPPPPRRCRTCSRRVNLVEGVNSSPESCDNVTD